MEKKSAAMSKRGDTSKSKEKDKGPNIFKTYSVRLLLPAVPATKSQISGGLKCMAQADLIPVANQSA